jgi:hypothetical protein
MVAHEPDIASYGKRLIRLVDGTIESDDINAFPTLLQQPPNGCHTA